MTSPTLADLPPLREVLAEHGYEPYRDEDGAVRLRSCPYHALAERWGLPAWTVADASLRYLQTLGGQTWIWSRVLLMSTGWLTCVFAAKVIPVLAGPPDDATGPCVTVAIVTFAGAATVTETDDDSEDAAKFVLAAEAAVTVMMAVPGALAVTTPAAETDATVVDDDT